MKRILLLTILLVGCANAPMLWGPPLTPEERAALEKEAAEAEAREQQEKARAIMARYTPFCSQLGFKEKTAEFADCILRLYYDGEAKERDRRTRLGAAFRSMSEQMRQNRPTVTTCDRFLNSIKCTTQ